MVCVGGLSTIRLAWFCTLSVTYKYNHIALGSYLLSHTAVLFNPGYPIFPPLIGWARLSKVSPDYVPYSNYRKRIIRKLNYLPRSKITVNQERHPQTSMY